MPINLFGKIVDNFNYLGTQLQKIYFQDGAETKDTLVWENWKLVTGSLQVCPSANANYGDGLLESVGQVFPAPVKPKTIAFKYRDSNGSPGRSQKIQIIGIKPDGSETVLLDTHSGLFKNDQENIYEIPEELQQEFNRFKMTMAKRSDLIVNIRYVQLREWYVKGSASVNV